MLQTELCELLGIEVPIIQAAMAACTSAELVSAVSNAGELGTVTSALVPLAAFKEQLTLTVHMTKRPFAVNHSLPFFNEEAFAATLEVQPAVISFALGQPGELVKRAHAVGSKVMVMVNSVGQALQAVSDGVDIINAQGNEAGGFSGTVSTMALVPQIVDAVSGTPVVASGGIADGRGLAAAIMLGAHGIAMGTRFLASAEAPISDGWKQSIVEVSSEKIQKVAGWNKIFPLTGAKGFDISPNALETPFLRECAVRGSDQDQILVLNDRIMNAVREGKFYDLVPLTGQIAGAIHGIRPAAEIVLSIAAEAEGLIRQRAAMTGTSVA